MIAAADINRQQGLGSLHLFRLVQELCVCESLNLYPSNQYRCLGWRIRQQTACPEEVQPQENVGFTWRWWQRSGHFGTSGHGPVCLQGADPLLPVLSGEGQPPQYRRHGPPVASRPSVHDPPPASPDSPKLASHGLVLRHPTVDMWCTKGAQILEGSACTSPKDSLFRPFPGDSSFGLGL